MKQQFKVTIATGLDTANICNVNKFPYSAVIDTRHCEAGKARAIEETVLLRLNNFFIDYAQLPLDFSQPTQASRARILRTIIALHGDVLVLTDQIEAFEQYCSARVIPFRVADRGHLKLERNAQSR